ncbi:MAG: TlpA family protein disulfide reductase [Gammaproteobacteria bacterium]|nr:TlpA family protein disulfide reductase [Gammaproteobacteria bacterium]MCK5262286.1 TlpA family protein disulfide reductase [Gammaproteobacteria bacterium]
MQKFITFIFSILLLTTFTANAAWEQPELGYKLSPLAKPVDAPNFVLNDMDEYEYDFSEYRGKVVLLNFWATWCPPCKREMPSMERVYQNHQDDDFTVIGVNQMEDGDRIFAFTGSLDLRPTFNILLDTDSRVSQAYNVRGLPTTYLIDKKGRVRYRAVGGREFDHPEVEKIIQSLMDE